MLFNKYIFFVFKGGPLSVTHASAAPSSAAPAPSYSG